MPTVGLALIARDEASRITTLLDSVRGAFDVIAMLDTGSEDDTVKVFSQWCMDNDQECTVKHYDWIDDFADARMQADALLDTDWIVWADCDDVIVNAQEIRGMCERAPAELAAYVCYYDYAQDPTTGNSVCMLKRERIVRRGFGTWNGRVHEAQDIAGPVTFVPLEVVHWRHMKLVQVDSVDEANKIALGSNSRNTRILRKWAEDEPYNPRVIAYLGTEIASTGGHQEAIEFYQRYLDLETSWTEERAQVMRKYAASLIALDRIDDAINVSLQALGVLPNWPDSHITLAQCYYIKDEHDKAEVWARQALALGMPDTLLILNPLDYTFLPQKVLAGALAGQGKFEEAIEVARNAMSVFPDYMLNQGMMAWRAHMKRERTAETYVMCAQQLVAHDEQVKALTLLEQCVPHFATDHPKVVAYRSEVRERLLWMNAPQAYADHYEYGGSKPEDFLSDERALEICPNLPRANFALDACKFIAERDAA